MVSVSLWKVLIVKLSFQKVLFGVAGPLSAARFAPSGFSGKSR